MLYSQLIMEIKTKIYENNIDIDVMSMLIQKSHDWVSKNPSEVSRKLHNKILDTLALKHQGPEVQALQESYRFLPKDIEDLEHQFGIDPSNFGVVLRLGIEYSKIGRRERALQLLERVARSGYKEKQLAVAFLSEWPGKGN